MNSNALTARQLLLRALNEPLSCKNLTLQNWELLIRCARAAKLIATIGFKLEQAGIGQFIPEVVWNHFQAARTLAEYRQRLILWELLCLRKALTDLDVDIVVLKGGAYLLMDLAMATGRTVSDIDILVPKKTIQRVEECLISQGWETAKMDDYDQHYYREWMHEIPPLRHRDRFVEVDIHHTILPVTSRLHPEPELLFQDAVNVEKNRLKVLSPCDMVLHSVVHLFQDAELDAGDFRDLVDIHELLSLFGYQDPNFWDKLNKRAHQLKLSRPLYYACFFSNRLLNTTVLENSLNKHEGRPFVIIRLFMEYLVPLAILPEHPDYPRKRVAFARWLLYIRSHYLRMPLYLLLPHLLKKAKKRWERKNLDDLKSQHQTDDG